MNDIDRWVSHNLQRQRELLERQRQRRMQANLCSAVSRTSADQQHFGGGSTGFSSATTDSNVHRSASNIFQSSQSSNATTNAASHSHEAARVTQSRGSLYSFVGNSPTPAAAAGAGFHQQQPGRSSSSQNEANGNSNPNTLGTPTGEPKIITVKGITPPQSRRQSDDDANGQRRLLGRDSSADLRRPVLNVERLEPISSSFCSEADDEEKSFQGLNARHGFGGGGSSVSQRSPSSTTALASKRPSWNGEGEEDDASIPTEILNDEPLETLDVADNLEQFVMDPIRKNYTLKCRISRDKRGMDKGMFPTYYLHMEKNDGRKTFLMAARRRKKTTTANYLISIDPTDLRRNGQSFMAKVRSNAMGTMFTIYDNGENPKRSAIGDGVRRELCAVIYETNVLGLKGPRKMTIIIPGIYVDQKHNYVRPLAVRPISEKDSILERYKTNRLDEMVVLNNKQPVWNEDTQSYVLNFHGRVTQASVKNFQIVHSMQVQSYDQTPQRSSLAPDPNEYIIMQFGRIDCDTFTMDVRYPLSPIQAFGIAMTSFHGKLACE